ncbi:MAG: hypothetical protein HLUCCX10_00515 [Algoriphagus marincola HL-49]|uniref:DUF2141 domain-containing protein n=1 Tax=Algoriphagus marincola HL-49 TaxID=1305737 RepID=A0A0P7YFN8_9BACT|nr:MAG: hypothetical protein HLUCCX10_00515 [Algoriphagus marincola HL-49]
MLNLIVSLFLSTILAMNSHQNTQLELIINNGKSDNGLVRVLIFNGSEGFPGDYTKAFKALSTNLENKRAVINISNLPAGKYAITAYHDENGDGKMSKNPFGYPTDRFGFSNNPKILFSAPTFEKCLFEIKEGKSHTEVIDLR